MKEDWVDCALGDVVRLKNGYAFKSNKYTEDGIPVIRIGDIKNWNIEIENSQKIPEEIEYKQFIIQKGDILIAMSGATTGKFGIFNSEEKAYQNQRVGNFVPYNEKYINKNYLFYLLFSLKRNIEKDAYGGAQPNISSSKIESLFINYAPLPIQRAIVSRIEALFSSLDKGISELKTAQEQLKIYRQAVLKKAFEGELTREWREQQILSGVKLPTAEELLEQIKEERKKYYEEQLKDWESEVQQWEKGGKKGTKPGKPSKLKDYNEFKGNEKLINIPKEWYGSYLGYVIEEPKYGTSKKCSYEKSGIGVLRIPNISNGSINDLDLKFAEFSEEEIYNYRLYENDLLTIRSNGSVDLVGKCAIITKKDTNYLYAGYLIRLRPLEDVIEAKYLYYSLSSIDLRVQIETKAKSTSGVNNINSGELESLIIPLCSLPEQDQIVLEIEKRLSVCDKMEETIKISLEKANALRQSILKKAFDGKLLSEEEIEACNTEADYEPASVLLGRIQEEKEKNR